MKRLAELFDRFGSAVRGCLCEPRPASRHYARRIRGFRPRLEELEQRRLLSVFTVNDFSDTIDVNLGDGIAADASGKTTC